MKPPESFIGQPIRSLQTMLRVLSQEEEALGVIIPDGIYGVQTQSAVSRFQRSRGLPVTGATNQATWEAIVRAYDEALLRQTPVLNLELPMKELEQKGNSQASLLLLQAILYALQNAYGCFGTIPPSGEMDAPCRSALKIFQSLCGLPPTGEADTKTWYHLTAQYPLALHKGSQIP